MDFSSLEFSKNTTNRKGTDYELFLSMLCLKRAVETNNDFRIATERTCDEKFDDVYVHIGKVYYVQAKHRDDLTKRISYGDLASQTDTSFSLMKYFNSYKKIKVREDKDTWDKVQFLICTTINPDYEGLKKKGIQVVEVLQNDGVFKTYLNQVGNLYKLKICSKETNKELFKDEFSTLRKLCKNLLILLFEGKKVNIEQLPMFKSYHLALASETMKAIGRGKIKLTEEFVKNSDTLSPEVKKFRELLYGMGREFLREKNANIHTMYSEERKKYEEILKKYAEVLNNGATDQSAMIMFWDKMNSVELECVGQFGELQIRSEKKQREFADKMSSHITSNSSETIRVDPRTNFGQHFFNVFGYVLNKQENRIGFNDHFLKSDELPRSFSNFKTMLRKNLGEELFGKLLNFHLNYSLDANDEEKLFKEKIYWNLIEDSFEDASVEEEIEEFQNKLIFVVTPKEDELGRVIQGEMKNEFGEREGEIIYNTLHSKLVDWIKYRDKRGRGRYLTKSENPYSETMKMHPRSIWFNVGKPIASFTGRKRDLGEIHKMLQSGNRHTVCIVQNVLVSGMGGIGKSELARKYADMYKNQYAGNVIWIDAESSTIKNSFKNLADRLNINTHSKNGNERPLQNIAVDVYNYFARKESLFIFDNAEKYRDIKTFLPNVGFDAKKPYVLITSRNRKLFKKQEHGEVGKWELGLLSEEEAMELVKNNIEINEGLNDKDVLELVTLLGRLPLALQHAVAYINESECGICQYVEDFRKSNIESKRIMEENLLDTYDSSIFITFTMAVKGIERKRNVSNLAVEILYMLAFFSSEKIPNDVFMHPALNKVEADDASKKKERAEEILNSSIKMLHDYCMINEDFESNSFTIHRLLQHVIRVSLRCETRTARPSEESTLKGAMEAAYESKLSKLSKNHFISLWCYASQRGSLIDEFYFKSIGNTTPIHLLSENGNCEEVDVILNHIKSSHGDMFKKAIQARDIANTHDKGVIAYTPLHSAVWGNNSDTVNTLIKYGADINARDSEKFIPNDSSQGNIEESKPDLTEEDVQYKFEHGYTPLETAAALGLNDITEALAKHLDPLKRSKYILQSKILSDDKCHLSEIEQLFKDLTNEEASELSNFELDGYSPLQHAAYYGYEDVVEYLINKGAVIKRSGRTPLHRATRKGHLAIVKLLTSRGSDPMDADENGETCLHVAAKDGKLPIVQYFVDELKSNTLDINVRDGKGNTPLNCAIRESNLRISKFLLRKGAEITPIHYDEGEVDVRSKLIQKISKVVGEQKKETNQKDDHGIVVENQGEEIQDMECPKVEDSEFKSQDRSNDSMETPNETNKGVGTRNKDILGPKSSEDETSEVNTTGEGNSGVASQEAPAVKQRPPTVNDLSHLEIFACLGFLNGVREVLEVNRWNYDITEEDIQISRMFAMIFGNIDVYEHLGSLQSDK